MQRMSNSAKVTGTTPARPVKVAMFSTRPYDKESFLLANHKHGHHLSFFEARLSVATASLAFGYEAVCVFVHDFLDGPVLLKISATGTRLIALRCAGYNNVDLETASKLGMTVIRVPAYSPHAVAEHAVGLILALNRHIHRAYNRVREMNFSIDGLLGFDLKGKTVGVVGTGAIGSAFCKIMLGFGCRVIAYDPVQNPELAEAGVEYAELQGVITGSDIISLHCPYNPGTHHLVDADSIAEMKDGVMIINTSRGALLDTAAVIEGLKTGKVGYLGIDVYEEEADLFYEDHSNEILQDELFARLLTFPNVIVTGHQAFFTKEAITNIAETTLSGISEFSATGKSRNAIVPRN